MVTLYCRADQAALGRILAAGLQTAEPRTAILETRQDFKAGWLQRYRPVDVKGERPYIVKIKLDCDFDELDCYDGSPADKPKSEWLVPVDLIHARGSIKVAGPHQ